MKNITPNIALVIIFPTETCSQLVTLDKTVIQQTLDTTSIHAEALQAPDLCPYLPGTVKRDVVVRMNGSLRSFIYAVTDYDRKNKPIKYTSEVRVGTDGPVISEPEFTSRDILSKYVKFHLAQAQGTQVTH